MNNNDNFIEKRWNWISLYPHLKTDNQRVDYFKKNGHALVSLSRLLIDLLNCPSDDESAEYDIWEEIVNIMDTMEVSPENCDQVDLLLSNNFRSDLDRRREDFWDAEEEMARQDYDQLLFNL